MASMLDCESVFFARMDNMGLKDFVKRFKEIGWTTMANFAFSVEFQPGTGPSKELLHNVVFKRLFPDMQEGDCNKEIIAVRRLYWESYSRAAVDMHRRMSPEAETAITRQLPKEERGARLAALKAKLGVGFEVAEETEPSDLLVDKFVTMQERGVLKYLQWEELTKWDTEIRGEPKKDPYFRFVGKHLEYEEPLAGQTADTASDLKLANAFTRRGIALELAQLMSYTVHNGMVQMFLRGYARTAVAGHAEISLIQIKNADEEVFVRLAAKTRLGLNLGPGGVFPLDALLPDILKEQSVVTHLAPLQLSNPSTRMLTSEPSSSGGQSKAEKRYANDVASLKAENKRLKAANNNSKGKGKGKDKGKKGNKNNRYDNGPMPRELWGLESKTPNGAPICFGYNPQSGRQNASEHGGCRRGKHVCAKKGCGGQHPAFECRK